MKIKITLNHLTGKGEPLGSPVHVPAGFWLSSFYIGDNGYVNLEFTDEKTK